MRTLDQSIQLLKKNLRSIVSFELTYRLICMAIVLPLLSGLFQLSLHLAGYEYLSEDRLIPYLLTPTTILILLLVIFVSSLNTAFEIFCIIPAYHASYHEKEISLTAMYRHGLFILKKSLDPKNFPLFLHTLILIPLTNISVLSGYISSWIIPDFLIYYIHSNKSVFYALTVIFILIMLVSIRFCLVLHCYALEEGNYHISLKKAKRLTKKHYFSTIAYLILWNIILLIVLGLIVLFSFFITVGITRLFFASDSNAASLFYSFTIILTVLFDIYIFLNIPFSFAMLSSIYYRQKEKKNLPIPAYIPEGGSLLNWVTRRFFLLVVLIACLFLIFYFNLVSSSDFFWNQNLFAHPTITAHRGDSKVMPENTIAAFESAIEKGADVIELDIQYTLDHEIVVFHDTSMRRLAGSKAEVGMLNYNTLKKYDVAQKFDALDKSLIDSTFWEKWEDLGITEEMAYHTVPTLSQVLAFCKGRIDLNIEIKSSPYNQGIEQDLVSLLEEYDYIDNCVIVAKDPDILKTIKSCNDDVRTIYLLSIAYGTYSRLDYIDGVSIKSSFLTRKLVNDIHDNGKEVFAWTVNSPDEMDRMYSLGIDSLITDYPSQAQDLYYSRTLNPTLYTWLKQISHAFSLFHSLS